MSLNKGSSTSGFACFSFFFLLAVGIFSSTKSVFFFVFNHQCVNLERTGDRAEKMISTNVKKTRYLRFFDSIDGLERIVIQGLVEGKKSSSTLSKKKKKTTTGLPTEQSMMETAQNRENNEKSLKFEHVIGHPPRCLNAD